jgi:PKD repeat protein
MEFKFYLSWIPEDNLDHCEFTLNTESATILNATFPSWVDVFYIFYPDNPNKRGFYISGDISGNDIELMTLYIKLDEIEDIVVEFDNPYIQNHSSHGWIPNTVDFNMFVLTSPEPEFDADIVYGEAPLHVQFTDLSGDPNITEWLWDFGDDTTSIIQHPLKVYNNAGIYPVSLTVSNIYGSNTIVKHGYIVVLEPVIVEDYNSTVKLTASYRRY